ncbi:hypothetical [Yersinia pestis KIM10+]|uniref:Uncharacterized protein n=1 Tax=Yersinia pestis TaxID=632 RepID=Q8CKW1_YERPE|nr:hypothetical [Yersinia pestis KIM10+]
MFDWRIFILADINAQYTAKMGFFNIFNKVVDPMIIKPHAVDQTFSFDDPE